MTVSAQASTVFAALSDPTRLRMLDWVAEGNARTATALAAQLPISRQAVSKHLEVLVDARLVSAAKVGRETRYQVESSGLDPVAAWLERRASMWDDRLAAFAEHVEAKARLSRSTARPDAEAHP